METRYNDKSKSALIQRILELEAQNSKLQKQLEQSKSKSMSLAESLNSSSSLFQNENIELNISKEPQFSWAGNLGQWKWDYASGKVLFNRKKVEVLGYDFVTFPKHVDSFTKLLHPEDYTPTMQNMRRHLKRETPVYEVEYRIRARDGSYKWFYDRGVVTERLADGTPKTIIGIVFDIDERKRYQQEMEDHLNSLKNKIKKKGKYHEIISICASCKAIQETPNHWIEIEEFFRDTFGLQFSHGICPSCVERLYPETFQQIQISK